MGEVLAGRKIRVLFFSSFTVSPTTGGGNIVYNLLEPAPEGYEVFYAGPGTYPPHMAPFPEIRSRVLAYPEEATPFLGVLREGKLRNALRGLKEVLRLNSLVVRMNTNKTKDQVLERLSQQVEELRPDVLLVAPQPLRDVIVATEVSERFDLPLVAWFMDDYYKDRFSRANVNTLWNRAHSRFVISESMGETFSRLYGGDYEVLAHSIDYSREFPTPTESPDGRLRILYAGSVNQYYTPTMKLALREFAGLGDRVSLDIYTGDDLPEGDSEVFWRKFPLIKSGNLVQRLREYDVLLLLSNFERKWKTTAETAQASKLAEYMASGRCILAYGPEYAENVRYVKRHGIGEVVTSAKPGALRETIQTLSRDPARRRELGERAYVFGRQHRDRAKNHDRLWRALREATRTRSGG
jgi:glycosyltransferase involved in cell wall biosynthesis